MFSRTGSTIRQFAPAVRRMSTNPPPTKKMPKPNNTVRNVVTAVLLLGFVGGVYYTSIAKMRQTVSNCGMSYRLLDGWGTELQCPPYF